MNAAWPVEMSPRYSDDVLSWIDEVIEPTPPPTLADFLEWFRRTQGEDSPDAEE